MLQTSNMTNTNHSILTGQHYGDLTRSPEFGDGRPYKGMRRKLLEWIKSRFTQRGGLSSGVT